MGVSQGIQRMAVPRNRSSLASANGRRRLMRLKSVFQPDRSFVHVFTQPESELKTLDLKPDDNKTLHGSAV